MYLADKFIISYISQEDNTQILVISNNPVLPEVPVVT